MSEHDNGRRRLFFDPKIDAGNILTAFSMLGTILIACAVFYARDAVKEQRISNLETSMVKVGIALEQISLNQTKLGVLMDGFQRDHERELDRRSKQ